MGLTKDELVAIHNMQGSVGQMAGLVSRAMQTPPSIGARASKLSGCLPKELVNPTHCHRTVSQRALMVSTRFASKQGAAPSIAAGADIIAALTTAANGIFGGSTEQVFNDANVNEQRKRIYDLVLAAIRAKVNVLAIDGEAVGAGAINTGDLAHRIEENLKQYLSLTVYHSSDRNDPWIDKTALSYFDRPNDEFVLVPPVKWIERNPAMKLEIVSPEFGPGPDNSIKLTTRALDAQLSVSIDCLFVPAPAVCGVGADGAWPGHVCASDQIANTATYKGGAIQSAVKRLVG